MHRGRQKTHDVHELSGGPSSPGSTLPIPGEIKFLIAKPVSLRVLLLTLNTSLLTYESPVTWGNDQIAARSKSTKKQTLSRVLLYIF